MTPVSNLAELARDHTSLSQAEVGHLLRLVASWGLAADLCFADLLLWVRADGPDAPERGSYVVVGQVRPATSQTLYLDDMLGLTATSDKRPVTHRAFRSGEICEGASPGESFDEQVQVVAIPVRFGGRVVGVVSRESAPSMGRRHGELEKAYLSAFDRLARMITLGEFPFAAQETTRDEIPRVGDGAVHLDGDGCIEYASPNANSAMHRLGVLSEIQGRRLGDLGVDGGVWRQACQTRLPATAELTAGNHTNVLAHAIPLLERRNVVGGLLLLRDISELRRLDRLLVTKDTHIREIHHRVKNNLQTISSLLRIQARRLQSPEARQAIEESVRRIASIAVVHETLSREAAEDVPFGEIARPLVRMVEESLVSPDLPVAFRLSGESIDLPAAVATPLALIITELLQNAVDHAFADGAPAGGGQVCIELETLDGGLRVVVVDNGSGPPQGFDLERPSGLGLSIVRTLVQSELRGSMIMRDRKVDEGACGTRIELWIPPPEADRTGILPLQTA
ncbi:MAG: two-component system, sensor histidine kinase PdtaS [Acidimicrobiia bacterium]|jgi:two-component sensor histidine kinase|nr:two-component system, sensor histidine kinase PdtaS [Acidimicrobiia bacterium]